MINVAQTIMSEGMCSLQSLFQQNFLGISYTTVNAKRRILQMPLITLLLKLKKGKANIYVMELIHGIDYEKLEDNFESNTTTTSEPLSTMEVRNLLMFARSDRERELVRYTGCFQGFWFHSFRGQTSLWFQQYE